MHPAFLCVCFVDNAAASRYNVSYCEGYVMHMNQNRAALIKLTVSMILFGTIGIFVKHIPLQSSMIALVRGIVGTIFLLSVIACRRKPISIASLKANFLWLSLSGACIGFNWILLFESYRYTSVAVSTLCYYMAPILVILASPLLLKESLTVKKVLCVITAIVGMILISGVLQSGSFGAGQGKGILFGLSAAVLYASVVLMNKKIKNIDSYDKTVMQLGVAALVLLPYCAVTYQAAEPLTVDSVLLLLTVGVVHTGFAYYLYFASMSHLSAQSVAVISYLDPVVAVILSVVLLSEPLRLTDLIGAILILGAALVSELHAAGKSKP